MTPRGFFVALAGCACLGMAVALLTAAFVLRSI